MTARLISSGFDSSATIAPFQRRFSGTKSAARKPASSGEIDRSRSVSLTANATKQPGAADWLRTELLGVLPQGVVVVSHDLKPVYWNEKAQDLCQQLSGSELSNQKLPNAISEVCHRLLKDEQLGDRALVMECVASTDQLIRISARWLHLPAQNNTTTGQDNNQPYILVFLENRNDTLRSELRIEQKKYDLTDREAEIWMLLRQEYSYQEIAKMLQISLNTVKTHVKNVYAKRRSCQGRDKFWCVE